MHETFLPLLEETLQHHGIRCTRNAALEGRSGTVYTVPLLAELDGKAFILDAHLDDAPLHDAAVQDMADVMHDAGADGGVMCHLAAAEAGAADEGVVLWGRDELVRLVGAARLAAATGTKAPPPRFSEQHRSDGPVAERVDDLLPPAFQDPQTPGPHAPVFAPEADPDKAIDWSADEAAWEPAAHGADPTGQEPEDDGFSVLGGIDLDALGAAGELDPATPSSAGPAARPRDPSTAPPADAPRPAPEEPGAMPEGPGGPTPGPERTGAFTHPLLPVRVLPDEARVRAKDKVYHVDAVEMVLQPVHLIDYECDLLAEGSLRYDTITGRVQVDGTDKTATEVDPEAVDPAGFTRLEDVPDLPRHERTLRTTRDRAKQVASGFLLDAHTRLVDIEVEDEDLGYAYTEKKRVAPRPDHIRLNPIGTFHRVLWRLRGPNGQVDVDALTGAFSDEALQRPNPDAVMLD